jgi:hypothetical protein
MTRTFALILKLLPLFSLASVLWYIPFLIPRDAITTVRNNPHGNDFAVFWAGPRIMRDCGARCFGDPALFQQGLERALDYPGLNGFWTGSGPTMLLIDWPFSLIEPYLLALLAWTLAGIAAFVAVLRLGLPQTGRGRWLVIAVLSAPALVTIIGGQTGFFTGAMILAAFYHLERRPLASGAFAGLLAIKPQMGVFLPVIYLARRRPQALLAAAVVGLGMVGLTILIWGREPWTVYLEQTLAVQRLIAWDERMDFGRAMSGAIVMNARAFHLPMAWAWTLQLLGIALASWYAIEAARKPFAPFERIAIWTAALFVATPYSLNYDLVPLIGALVWLAANSPALNPFIALALTITAIIPGMAVPIGLAYGPILAIGNAVVFALVIAGTRASVRAEAGEMVRQPG